MTVTIDGTKGIVGASWATGGRPSSPAAGQRGFNTTLDAMEVYDGTQWQLLSEGISATGGIITIDGTYTIHTFLNSGVFTPNFAGNVDYLVVGGGGSGGWQTGSNGGGGGAGGLRSTVTATGGGGSVESALAVTAQAYTITVGAGGAALIANAQGNAGGNSVFSSITSVGGGGGGGGGSNVAGSAGGSGGGGGYATGAGGAGTSNQGYAGGTSAAAGNNASGGGGGAAAVGVAGGSGLGTGGAGLAVAISGASVYYAGGGGGAIDNSGSNALGGIGGGGQGSVSGGVNGLDGSNGLGGGGGGAAADEAGAGGSGVVIIRYTTVSKVNQIGQGPQIMIVHHQLPVDTAGGTSISGVNTRDLNTIQYNSIIGASLASKRVTLPAGTYHMKGWATCYVGETHKTYIYDITNSRRVIAGESAYSLSSGTEVGHSHVNGVISTTGTTVFELRQYILRGAANVLGTQANYIAAGPEVYAELEITRIA